MKRHKWNGKTTKSSNENKGGLVVSCIKCGCVKEIIGGKPSYFIDDTSHDKAPDCDERLIGVGYSHNEGWDLMDMS